MFRFVPVLFISVMLLAALSQSAATSKPSLRSTISANATPTPTKQATSDVEPARSAVDGPVTGTAAGAAISLPVRDLPAPKPARSQSPREINPQNTVPVKTAEPSSTTVPRKRLLRRTLKKNR